MIPSTPMPAFHDLVRQWRQEAGATLRAVADATGLSVPYVSDIEWGRRNPPSPDYIRTFSRLVGKADEVEVLLTAAMHAKPNREIKLKAKDEAEEKLLVALARSMHALTRDEIRVLSTYIERKQGGVK